MAAGRLSQPARTRSRMCYSATAHLRGRAIGCVAEHTGKGAAAGGGGATASPGDAGGDAGPSTSGAAPQGEKEWWKQQWSGPAHKPPRSRPEPRQQPGGRSRSQGGRGGAAQQERQRREPKLGAVPAAPQVPSVASAAATPAVGGVGVDDIIVIGKGSSSAYQRDLEGREGGAYWEEALAAVGGEEDDSDGEGDDDGSDEDDEGGGDGWVMDAEAAEAALAARLVAVGAGGADEDPLALLRDLLPDLGGAADAESTAAGAHSSAATPHALWARVYTSRELPQPRVGPVMTVYVAGCGRGVVVTAPVGAGDTLLVAPPLGVLYCEEGSTPENEDLAARMAASEHWTREQRTLLAMLAPRGVNGEDLPLAPLERLALLPSDGSIEAPNTAADAEQAGGNVGVLDGELAASPEVADLCGADVGPPPVDLQQLCELVNANVLGEAFEDPVLCALRGTASCGHVGLWPAAAMLNHSCSPNAVAYTIGDRLVVRAVQDLDTGVEVTLSYLGQNLMAPLATRQDELRDTYGFTCRCQRCHAEAALEGSAVAEVQQAALAACAEPATEALLEAVLGDQGRAAAKATEAYQRLSALRDALEEAMAAADLEPEKQGWVKASTWPLFDALSILSAFVADRASAASARHGGSRGGRSRAAGYQVAGLRNARGAAQRAAQEAESCLEESASVLAAVAYGSSAHCDVAMEVLLAAETSRGRRRGGDGEEDTAMEFAELLAEAAHAARYGGSAVISRRMLQLLMDTRAGLLGGLAEVIN